MIRKLVSVLDSVILVVADLAGLHPIIDEDIGQGPKAALDKRDHRNIPTEDLM